MRRRKILIGLLFFSLFSSFTVIAYAWDVEGTVRVNGSPKVRYGGVQPNEVGVCGNLIMPVEDLVVGSHGELKNAVVWVEGDFSGIDLARAETLVVSKVPVVLDQQKCQFNPRVVLVSKGQEVYFHSSDSTLHHVAGYSTSGKNMFEYILKDQETAMKHRFDQPGPHLMRCGFHPWMGAVVFVRNHPFYAVTDAQGHYKISGLKAGNYRVIVWHETLGFQEAKVTSRGEANVVFESTAA